MEMVSVRQTPHLFVENRAIGDELHQSGDEVSVVTK